MKKLFFLFLLISNLTSGQYRSLIADKVSTVIVKSNTYFDNGRTRTYVKNALRVGNTIYGLLDPYTGERINYNKITGVPDAEIDSVIIVKKGSEYFERIHNVINVKWFGAVADGVTDNSRAFQAATAAMRENETLFFPEGNFFTSAQISSTVKKTRFTGKGATIIYASNKNGIALFHDSCEVDNLNFRSSGLASGNWAAIFLQGSKYSNIHNNRIDEPSANGIGLFAGSNYNIVQNNYINGKVVYAATGADYSAVLLGYADLIPSVGNSISNNIINGNFSLKVGVGLIGAGSLNNIANNKIQRCLEYGVVLYETALQPDYAVNNNIVVNNIISDIGTSSGTLKGMGIYLQQAHKTDVLQNQLYNTCIGSLGTHVLAQGAISADGCTTINVADNIINSIKSNVAGVIFVGVFSSTLSGNKISSVYNGIQIKNSSFTDVIGNSIDSIRNVGISSSFDTSAYTYSENIKSITTGERIKISDNTIASTSTAISLHGFAYSVARLSEITNNKIRTHGSAIQASYLIESRISNNTILGVSGYGNAIELSLSDSNKINNNTIKRIEGNFTYGIYSTGSKDAIWYNDISGSSIPLSPSATNTNRIIRR